MTRTTYIILALVVFALLAGIFFASATLFGYIHELYKCNHKEIHRTAME